MEKHSFKCSILLLFLGILGASNNVQAGYNQTVPFKEILVRLEEKFNVRFNYNTDVVGAERVGSADISKLQKSDLKSFVERAAGKQKISVEKMSDQLYVITPKLALNRQTGAEAAAKTVIKSVQKSVSGRVIDGADNTTLPGVSVSVKGTQIGTVTDADGRYTIPNVPEGSTLVFSSLGFETQEVPVGTRPVINISMTSSKSQLDEVVVVGYGTQRRGDLTGAITSLSSGELTRGGSVSNIGQSLQGKASGVVVTQNSKAPGGSISIRIRGSNSVSSTNEPLYVVDGFPTNSGVNLNPDDVESMEILKDASATAIYGSRGANGVVLITTKRGKAGQSNISYSGYAGTQQAVVPFDMLSGKQYMELSNALYKEISGQENQENGAYTQSQLMSDVNTDWIDATTRTGVVQSHNLQFTGGAEKTKVLTSLGYFKQEGILKTTDFSRFSGRINIDHQINDYIKAGASVMAQRENSNYQNYSGNILNSNVLYGVLTYDPTVPLYNADGSFGRPPGGQGDNPLANLLSRKNDLENDKLNGTMYLELKPIEGLTARMSAGTEILNDKLGGYLSKESYQGSIDNGVANISEHSLTHNLLDFFITYKKDFNKKHSFDIMGGYAYEKFINSSRGIGVYGFSTDLFGYNNVGAASTITGVSSYKSENILVSFFGRANYSFNDRYLVTLTVRQDGSSRFGEDNKWGTFPSGSVAWKVINEPFMTNQKIFSDLKFRAGYGRTGNERIGNYASYGLMSNASYTFDGINNTTGSYLNIASPENTKLKWETTAQYNVGTDMSFFKDRVTVTMDAYYKKTNDLLIKVNLPYYTGYTLGLSNVGSVENKGFEFGLVTKNFVNEFTWNTRLNFALNRNKVLSLGGQSEILLSSSKPIGNVSEESYAVIREGKPLGSLYGYKYLGVIQAGESYAPQPNAVPGDPKFEDVNGDGLISSGDRTIIGSAYPKLTFGFTNNFGYKNFDLSFFIYGNLGNDLLNMTRMNLEWKRTTQSLDRWTPENPSTDLPRNGFFYSQYGGYVNDHFIEDASFLRLRNITLGYTLPFKAKSIKSLRVYAMAENLFTISGYSGWDPEVDTKAYENDPTATHGGNAQTANAGAGMDFNSYPSMKAFTVGISANF